MRWLIPLLMLNTWLVTAAPADACGALSQQEVEKALGRPAGKGVEHRGPSHSACEFESREGSVSVAIHDVARDVTLERQQSELAAAFSEAKFQPVQLSEMRGFLMEVPEAGAQIHVLGAGRRYVIVSVLGYRDAATTARAIASIVAGRVCRPDTDSQKVRPN